MRRYGAALMLLGVLYCCSRFILIPISTGRLHRLLAWYFHDLLAGAAMLLTVNTLLTMARQAPFLNPLPVSVLILACGFFWEFITPMYLSRSVSDPWDLLAYWCGAMGCLWLEHFWSSHEKRPSHLPHNHKK